MTEEPRVYHLDWIRIVVILLLVPYHNAVTFAARSTPYSRPTTC